MKRHFKRIIATILMMTFILSCVSVPSSAALFSKRTKALNRYIKSACKFIEERPIEGSDVSYPDKTKTERSKLTASQKKLYDIFLKNVKNVKSFLFTCKSNKRYEDIGSAFNAITTDYPEYSDIISISEVTDAKGRMIKISVSYYSINGKKIKTAEGRRKLKKQLKEYRETLNYITETILNGMPQDISTIDKYRYLAIVLCYCTRYNYKAGSMIANGNLLEGSPVIKNSGSVFGPLLYEQAVCEGYAATYKYLCNKAGLYCEKVDGFERARDKVGHAWNLVKLDSGTYYVDTTWMDNENINSAEFYQYFLMTQKERAFQKIDNDIKATGKKSFRNQLYELFK